MTSLADLASRLSDELDDLARATEQLQEVICSDPLDKRDADYVQVIQEIDHSQQRLANLSKFLSLVSKEVDQGWQVNLERPLASVRLEGLKHRLGSTSLDYPTPVSGEIELF